ncbi:hypothetical protein [Phormidium sp. CCY1219]|uniref:hypothetical protein n=1 Tax=Phormidium sp. CCY1219 TaxID=2886104 RepID=UPI002D1E8863|nr:hypothetical protein [Phormidium sp. CCY1219]MEB3827640.1 hypothetical protein [Phormidium sp. CCY1219]
MAREPQHAKQKTKLFQASRMQDCLDSIRESLVEHGALRRSQTMLGSTVGAIEPAYQWAIDQTTDYQQLSKTLKRKHQELQQRIEKTAQEVKESLRVKIEAIFQDAVNAIPSFAKENWNSNEVAMKRGWEQKLNRIRFESRLKTAYKEAGGQFNKEVSEALEAVRNELELVPQSNSTSFRIIQQMGEQFIGQKFLKMSDTIVAISDTIGLGVASTVGGVLTAAGVTMGVIPQICQSKEEKCKAVQKIIESFSENLGFEKQKTLKKTDKYFSESFADVAKKISLYFVQSQEGIEGFARCLESSKSQLYCFKTNLNKAYAKRIIDFCLEKYEPLADAAIQQTIAKVERNLGQHINIFIRPGVKLNKLPPT